jgi:serine/threonine protein kinase
MVVAPGMRLGRYEILKHLANGGMAEVLLARATGIENFEHHVVVKRIRGEQAKDERFVKMFVDEARLAAALHHQHIVKVHDIGQEHGEYFFAMEFVHGEDARKLLMHLNKKQQQIPTEHVLTIATGALAGLHHAHEHSLEIVHRDVSPANILIGFDGGVKVADFGIAKAAMRTQETRSGTLKGKVSYMSPEQCTGGTVDRRSDVFAMGIVLYELCTVRRLFKGDNDFMTMSSIVQGGVPPPTTVRPDLLPALEAIIMKALSLAPDRRYQSAEEMRLALEELAADAGLRMSASSLARFMKQQFGDRLEPWLSDEPPAELTIDFDGDLAGVAQTNVAIVADLDLRSSAPIMTAKSKVSEDLPAPSDGVPTWRPDKPTASGTPIAWSPETKTIDVRKRWLIGAGACVAVAVVLLIAVLSRTGGDERAQPAASPPPAAAEVPKAEPPKAEPPKAEPPKAEPPRPEPPKAEPEPIGEPELPPEMIPEPAGSGSAVAAAGSGSAKPPRKRPRPPRPAKPGSTPKWDPTTLFPKK